MKILHVTQGYYPSLGGTEWLFQRISEELAADYQDDVTVFTTNCYNVEGFFNPAVKKYPIGWQEINGVRVRRFPVLSNLSRALWKPQQLAYLYHLPGNQYLRAWAHGPIVPGLGRAIRENPADIIVSSSFPLMHMFTALKAARASGRGCVFQGALHPEDDWSSNRPMIYKAIQKADRYIANTQYEADFIAARGADSMHTHVVGVGVTPEPFMVVNPTVAKKRYQVEGGPVIGFVGQVAAQKVSMLIEAMPAVWEQHPTANLLIAGSKTTYTTEMDRVIRRWPAEYRRKTKIIYNFAEEEKAWLYNACDIFVYPSAWESFGIAYLEAWAAGKPVIGCRRGAVPWVINSGEDGLLVDYGDNDNLAGAILLLVENREWAENLGRTGQIKTMKRYTWKTIARQFRDVYELALEDNRRRNRK